MCGIVGILRDPAIDVVPSLVKRMTRDISHRGPDDEGMVFLSVISQREWQFSSEETDTRWNVALGCSRLSILDVSDAGHMPMTYCHGFWMVYNGEIYNFVEIRSELQLLGYTFRSLSDTEVILAAYVEWGAACFARFRGMWGLVIVDCIHNEAILCRDRLGIKPLYFWQGPGIVAAVSEIKQLFSLPDFTPAMNMATTAEYLRTGYEDPTRSFFRDVQVVPAGSWIRIPLSTRVPSPPEKYWYPERVPVVLTDAQEAGRLLTDKLRESVHLHLRSDVPVGCALSGGLDSSSLAILTNELKNDQGSPLHIFTSTFPGDPVDEREYFNVVVANIRAVPHAITPQPMTFLEELKDFVYTHDEPVGGLSVYAGYCLARLTREAGIPVSLNGQGGDEILSGYWQSYFMYLRQLGRNGHLLALMKHFTGAMMGKGNAALLTQVPTMLRRYCARSRPSLLMRSCNDLAGETLPILKRMLTLDEQTWRVEEIRSLYLPRLLKWEDRNSMAFSVEGRYPFLDHELIELCLSFAPQILYHDGWTKYPLRLGLRNMLPRKILQRQTKFGLEVPQDTWLCGPLRPTLERWLKQDRFLWTYVEREVVHRLAHQTWQLAGKKSEPGQALFRVFMFDQWADVFGVGG